MTHPMNSLTVVNRVRQVARDSGISLLEISRTADVSYSMLRRISRGRGNVCLAEAVAVSSVLGLSVESIFLLDDPKRAGQAISRQSTFVSGPVVDVRV